MSNLLRESSEQHLVDHENRQESYQHAISWLIAWAAFALAALLGFSRLSYGLLLPALQLDLGSSFSVLGALATVNFAGYLLGTLVVPILLTRAQNRARLNLLALFATNLLMIVSASSFTIWQLSIWRLLIGFFSAIATILTLTLTLERIYPQERGLASGLMWMGAAFGLVFSGVIAPLIISCDRTQSFAILRRKASPKNPEFGRFCRKDHSRGRKNCCIRLPQVLADTKFAEKSSPSDIHRLSSSFIQRLRNLRVIL